MNEVPTLCIENTRIGGYEEASEEEILAQPCVQAAIEKARHQAFDNRFETEEVAKRVEELRAQFPNHFDAPRVRFVRHVIFEGTYEAVLKQIAKSTRAGRTYGLVCGVRIEDGSGVTPCPPT